MSELLFYWVMLVLAADWVLIVWFNGSIFATPRAILEGWKSIPDGHTVRRFLSKLLLCPICLPIYVVIAMSCLLMLPIGTYLIFVMAATGVVTRIYNHLPIGNQ